MKWYNTHMPPSPVSYTLVTSEEEWQKVLKKLRIKTDQPFLAANAEATATTFEDSTGNLVCIVCMVIRPMDVIEDMALIVHEAVHVWQAIRRAIQEKKPSTEFEAYSIQTICYNLFNIYQEKLNVSISATLQRKAEAKQENQSVVQEC